MEEVDILLNDGYYLSIAIVNCDTAKIDDYYYYDFKNNIFKLNFNDTSETVDFLSEEEKELIKSEVKKIVIKLEKKLKAVRERRVKENI